MGTDIKVETVSPLNRKPSPPYLARHRKGYAGQIFLISSYSVISLSKDGASWGTIPDIVDWVTFNFEPLGPDESVTIRNAD